MLLESTSQHGPRITFTDALLRGIAPDGGLYLPVDWPRVTPADLASWRGLPFEELAVRLVCLLLAGELPDRDLERLTREALNFPAPTVRLSARHSVLELFHGPTLAFKDFGARFLARFFGYLAERQGRNATILVATSGDTGGAVARGFHRVRAVRVVVLYPAGKVSRFQEAQMATLGDNITALRVPGTFDDCQRLVKKAFLDESLSRLYLSSANSINVGRLLPQSFYYVASYLVVTGAPGEPVVFAVPSGNLGNLTAGVLARRLGVPISRLIAATNANDVLPEYLATGTFRPRPSIETSSNAMDVGNPSNFTRLLALHALSIDEMRGEVWGTSVDERETEEMIRRAHSETGYLFDPHGAVGFCAATRYAAAFPGTEPIVTLATAHPAKFAGVIRRALGLEPPLPEAYDGWQTWPPRAEDLPDVRYETFRDFLRRL